VKLERDLGTFYTNWSSCWDCRQQSSNMFQSLAAQFSTLKHYLFTATHQPDVIAESSGIYS